MTDFYKKKKFSLLIFALEASQVVYFFTYSKVGFPAEITFGVKQVTVEESNLGHQMSNCIAIEQDSIS